MAHYCLACDRAGESARSLIFFDFLQDRQLEGDQNLPSRLERGGSKLCFTTLGEADGIQRHAKAGFYLFIAQALFTHPKGLTP